MKIRIYYEDTDAAGIVYYANYLKFCERARSELFFSRGLSPQGEGYFVVRRFEADYIGSAKLGDVIEVTTKLERLGGASLELLQEVWLKREVIFRARVRLAYLKGGRPARIPPDLAALLRSWA